MDIESMDCLLESCRICLNKGEINLFKHQINLAEDISDENHDENTQIYVIELFKIYQNFDDLLSLSEEFQNVCYSCVSDLVKNYEFFRKLKKSNKKIQLLYEEAQEIEAAKLDDLVIEVFETEDDNDNFDEPLLEDKYQKEISAPKSNEKPEIEIIENVLIEQQHKSQPISVETMFEEEISLNEENKISTLEHETEKLSNDLTATKTSDHKRSRNKDFLEKSTRVSGPALPTHDDASLVITQFLPTTTEMMLQRPSSVTTSNSFEDEKLAVQDLNTVEYAAIEIKSSNFQQLIKNNSLDTTSTVGAVENESDKADSIFVCKYCPQAFSAAEYLISHVRKSHVCKYCTKAFVKSMDLYVHIREAHHQHKCAICHKTLSSHSNLRGHIKRVHGIRLPAQVALLDYKLPNNGRSEKKEDINIKTEIENTEMCF